MLNQFVNFHVPSTANANESITDAEFKARFELVATELARFAGGFTATQAVGGWVSDTHGLIVENVTVISCAASDDNFDELYDIARELAQDVVGPWSQEAIAINSSKFGMEFIS